MWFDRLGGIAWRGIAIVVAVAMVVVGTVALSAVILPIVLGLLFTCALRPIAGWLRARNVPAALCALLCVLFLTAASSA